MAGVLLGNTRGVSIVQVTFNPASIGAATTAEQTLTVPGVVVGDFVDVSKPTLTAGVGIVNARVTAADTVAVTFINATAGALDPGSEVYTIRVTRPEVTSASVVVI